MITEESSWKNFYSSADHQGAERGAHAFGFKAGVLAGRDEAAAASCGCITTNPESGDGPVVLGEERCPRCSREKEDHAFKTFCP